MATTGYNEADTRSKLIDPQLYAAQWVERVAADQHGTHGQIHREQSGQRIDILDGKPLRRGNGRVDYLLRAHVGDHEYPLTLAFVEAKRERLPPAHGLEQAKGYARRYAVPFVFSTNGHLFVEYDDTTGLSTDPRPLTDFPSPSSLRQRWLAAKGLAEDAPALAPLLTPYNALGRRPRYYQDAAIRAVLERIAQASTGQVPPRALLSLATGAGKTSIAVSLLQRLSDSGQLRRALFVCDRDELRKRAHEDFATVFGTDAKIVNELPDGSNAAKNARVHVATYQSLGIQEQGDGGFLRRHYPENHFSHIIIDECHRSAFGLWAEVLRRNPAAFQLGLTATPRELTVAEGDAEISADNLRHFGEPVYEYTLAQGIEDGYLAPCDIHQMSVDLDNDAIPRVSVMEHDPRDANTGSKVEANRVRERYVARDYDAKLQIPERLAAMCEDLFQHLLATGGPEQKTIVFCASDGHADRVAQWLNNRYVAWCQGEARARVEPYAFKCTAASDGNRMVADLRGTNSGWFIATTVDLLSTGVDVPCVRNIVFLRYLESSIVFHQMVGRGTRIDEASGKLMFRLYDYTNLIRLFGTGFVTPPRKPRQGGGGGGGGGDEEDTDPTLITKGFQVQVSRGGHYVLGEREGQLSPVAYAEYKAALAEQLRREAATLGEFRSRWIAYKARHDLMDALASGGHAAKVVQMVEALHDCDLFDVLAQLGYQAKSRTRIDRRLAFQYRHEEWLDKEMPSTARQVVMGIAQEFERTGTDGLESAQLWHLPSVERAGGMKALLALGKPADALANLKQRLFSA